MTKRPSKRDAAKGKIPRKKKAVAPHIKAAADRAEARARGEKITKPRVPIDPPVVPIVAPEHYTAKTEEAPTKGKVGRKSPYKPEMAEHASRLCGLGLTDEEIAQFFGITVRTIYKWKARHPEFAAAIKTGGAPADERVERSLFKRAVGYQQDAVKIFLPKGALGPVVVPYKEQIAPDTTACIFWLKNRRPDLWRDVNRHEHTGKDGDAIEVSEDGGMDRARRLALLLMKSAEPDGTATH